MLKQFAGMRKFIVIWFGQLVSLIGTAMTGFALTIWAYQQTGKATTLAALIFADELAFIIATPIAGALVDRWDRRRVLIASDLASGFVTILMLVLYTGGGLRLWHLYAAHLALGLLVAFQLPAYHTATALIVPKQQYARVSGMRSLAFYGSKTLAPLFAGALLPLIGLNGIMTIDVLSFLMAVGTLLLVAIPRPPISEEGQAQRGHILDDIRFGARYIMARPGLVGLTLEFAVLNFFAAITYFSILPALILARTGGDQLALGGVEAMMSLGGVIGGLALSLWGGPRRKIDGVLLGAGLSFCLGDLLFGVGRSVPVWMVAGFASAFFIPFIVGGDRAIWQAKVPPDIQGRVLSISQAVRGLTMPPGYLIGGLLADFIFEPLLSSGGMVARTFGGLVGTGPGSGMGLMFMGTWAFGTLASLAGYLFRPLRNVETDLPDHDHPLAGESPIGEMATA